MKDKDFFEASYDRRNQLNYWYPLIPQTIDTPETVIIPIPVDCYRGDRPTLPHGIKEKAFEAANKLGYPVFARTAISSNKHAWEKTCFISDPAKLVNNLENLLEHDMMIEHLSECIVLRKYIPMESRFTAWHGNLPVNKEFRCFIRDGKLECMHPYWPKDAIKQGSRHIKIKNWQTELIKLQKLTMAERISIEEMVKQVCKVPEFQGYWSVDFSKGKDGKWYLIDMAMGLASYHWETCKHNPERNSHE